MTINFSGRITNIFGKNATGKSTVFDAFTWLLFHKNAEDKTDFSIRTLGKNNVPIPKLVHGVTAILSVDGTEMEFRKDSVEDWEVQKGDTVERYTGSHSECFIDGVPISVGDYNKRVQKLLSIEAFKLITNPIYFCSTIKWQDRRKILFELSKNITDADIIADNPSLFNPLSDILQKHAIEDYKKKLHDLISKTQKQLDEIPARIDEAYRAMPEPVDTQSITAKITERENQLAELDRSLTDISALFEGYNKVQRKIFGLQNQQNDLVNRYNSEFQKERYKLEQEIKSLRVEYDDLQKYKTSRESLIASTEKAIAEKHAILKELREKWHVFNSKELQFDNDDFICPTCKRPFEEQDIFSKQTDLTENFNIKKATDLQNISEQGKAINAEISTLEQRISNTRELLEGDEKTINAKLLKIAQLECEFDDMKPIEPADIKGYQDLHREIEKLKSELHPPEINTDEISAKKNIITAELDSLKRKLAVNDVIEKNKQRIADLEKQEKELAALKAGYQKELQMCDAFTKAKIEKMESNINGLFKYVSFKLFKDHISGGESEICEVLIDGVPYTDANKAARINAGLDVINALSKRYNVTAPIFIDNRESVNEIIDIDSQIINLFVTTDDEQLRVEAV